MTVPGPVSLQIKESAANVNSISVTLPDPSLGKCNLKRPQLMVFTISIIYDDQHMALLRLSLKLCPFLPKDEKYGWTALGIKGKVGLPAPKGTTMSGNRN